MANSRRTFLKKSTFTLLAAGIPFELANSVLAQSSQQTSRTFSIPQQSLDDPLMYLKRSSFAPYLNSIFVVRGTTTPLASELELVQVATPSFKSRSKGREIGATMVRQTENIEDRFSLLFRSNSIALPQDVYEINHAALGRFSMLLVPVVNKDTRNYYFEAVINRIN